MVKSSNIFGVWREYTGKQSNPSIWDEKFSQSEPAWKNVVLQYLKKGHFVIGTTEVTQCLLSNDGVTKISPRSCFTDGEYVWSSAYIFYVEKFNLIPDNLFIKYILEKENFKINDISEELMEEIEMNLYLNYLR